MDPGERPQGLRSHVLCVWGFFDGVYDKVDVFEVLDHIQEDWLQVPFELRRVQKRIVAMHVVRLQFFQRLRQLWQMIPNCATSDRTTPVTCVSLLSEVM